MIRWKVYKTAKKWQRARNNLMYIYNWVKALKYVKLREKQLKEKQRAKQKFQIDWSEAVQERLEKMEASEVYRVYRNS